MRFGLHHSPNLRSTRVRGCQNLLLRHQHQLTCLEPPSTHAMCLRLGLVARCRNQKHLRCAHQRHLKYPVQEQCLMLQQQLPPQLLLQWLQQLFDAIGGERRVPKLAALGFRGGVGKAGVGVDKWLRIRLSRSRRGRERGRVTELFGQPLEGDPGAAREDVGVHVGVGEAALRALFRQALRLRALACLSHLQRHHQHRQSNAAAHLQPHLHQRHPKQTKFAAHLQPRLHQRARRTPRR